MPYPDFNLGHIPDSKRGMGLSNSRRATARKLILDNAKHLFARYGYDGTSLGAIAHRAGVPPQEITEQFDDKLGVLMAVFDDGWVTMNERLQDIVVNSINARQATLSIMAVMTRILERDRDWARLLLFESRRPHPQTGEITYSQGYRWFARLCTDLVVRGQKDGSFRASLHPRAIASMLSGALESLMRDRYLAEEQGTTTPLNGADLMSAFDTLLTYLAPEKANTKL